MPAAPDHFRLLTAAWLALVALTLLNLGLSEWARDLAWLPLVIAASMGLKGALIARCFIETHIAHPFIARIVQAFIAIAPIALVITAYFGAAVARWATL